MSEAWRMLMELSAGKYSERAGSPVRGEAALAVLRVKMGKRIGDLPLGGETARCELTLQSRRLGAGSRGCERHANLGVVEAWLKQKKIAMAKEPTRPALIFDPANCQVRSGQRTRGNLTCATWAAALM
jgi:hypothetical protein